MKPKKLLILAPVLLAATAPLASAHPGHGPADIKTGFFHPLTGWDHLLAMVTVGIWAAQLGGRARWLLPVSFVGAMALGAAIGLAGIHGTGIEWGIEASVILLGAALAFSFRPPLWAAALGVGVAGLFHGIAHGSELPANTSSIAFMGGMILGTALLHAAGVGARTLAGSRASWLFRIAGVGVAAAGVVLLVG